ncbi:hypothetical protein LINGRAPRIM_LOCUS2180 [Linum grandiflorum]
MGFKQIIFDGCPNAKLGEAKAVLEGIRWAWDQGHQEVIVETDSLSVQQAIVGNNVDLTESGVVIDECKVRLACQPRFSVVFGRRSCNGVAHTLARRSITSAVSVVGEAPPEWLNSALANICFSENH